MTAATVRWAADWRERAGRAGKWRLVYEIALTLLVTVVATAAAVVGSKYPAAPWLVGVTTPVLMALRLKWPTLTYVAMSLAGLATGGPNTFLVMVLSASLGYHVARWWQAAIALGVGCVCYVVALLWEQPLDPQWSVVLASIFVATGVLPAGVARLVRRRRLLLAAMNRRNVQLHNQQSEIARQAQTRERARIARDLHDSLGHKLTLLSLYAGMMRTTEPGRNDETVDQVRKTAAAAMTELRQILGILGQDDTQSLVRPLSGLDELAEQARASGARVEVVREGEPRPLATLTEHAAYRVIQEGLTNALRHAQGGAIVLSLRYEPDALIAGVANTAGQRVVGATSGQGLLGLAERVRVADGMLYSGPSPDGGFRLAATLPYVSDESAPLATEQRPVPPGPDFAVLIDRDRRRSRLTLAITGVVVAGLVALCLAGVVMWGMLGAGMVEPETYEAARVGAAERDVRAELPDPDWAVTGVAGGRSVPGATCVDYEASILATLAEDSSGMIYRFCFRDGVLTDKQAFEDR